MRGRGKTLGGPALGTAWREAEYCVVDLELTGLDPRRDDIVSIGAAVVRQGRVYAGDSFYTRVRPTQRVSRRSTEVHGLRDQDLDFAPKLTEVMPTLAGLIAGRALVAHSAWIEKGFLAVALRSAGFRLDVPIVDTAALVRRLKIIETPQGWDAALEASLGELGLPVHTPHHALGDALSTATLLIALGSRLERSLPGRRANLHDLVVG